MKTYTDLINAYNKLYTTVEELKEIADNTEAKLHYIELLNELETLSSDYDLY